MSAITLDSRILRLNLVFWPQGLTAILLVLVKVLRLLINTRKTRHRLHIFENQNKQTFFDFAILCSLSKRPPPEWYIFPRSVHWAETFLRSSDHFSCYQFKSAFRMSRASFYRLHSLLQPYIEKQTTRFRKPIPSERRLAIFLYHVANGSSYLVLEDQFGCGKSTISKIVREVTKAVVQHLSKQFIRFSTTTEAIQTMDYWKRLSGIPGVVACIDGSHIPIIQPTGTGPAYFNRKGFYSINVQGKSSLYLTG